MFQDQLIAGKVCEVILENKFKLIFNQIFNNLTTRFLFWVPTNPSAAWMRFQTPEC